MATLFAPSLFKTNRSFCASKASATGLMTLAEIVAVVPMYGGAYAVTVELPLFATNNVPSGANATAVGTLMPVVSVTDGAAAPIGQI